MDPVLADGRRNDVLSKIHKVVVETLLQNLALENVDAHRGMVEVGIVGVADLGEQVGGNAQGVKLGGIFGFLDETVDPPARVGLHDPEAGRGHTVDRNGGNGQVGVGFHMLQENLPVIHAVELVAGKNDEVFVGALEEIPEILAHRIGRALIPLRPFGSLLRGKDLDKAGAEIVEFVAGVDVPVQRCAVELGQDVDPPDAGIQTIADRDVPQPVFAPEGNRRLRALPGQGKQPCARPAAHDDGQHPVNREGEREVLHKLQLAREAPVCHVPSCRKQTTMCGIVGYIGKAVCAPILLDGLRRLEYRGYDSAGIATLDGGGIHVRKAVGRIADLARAIAESPPPGRLGISHTRWATHGAVTGENAHPHFDASRRLALVHNGVIENHRVLRDELAGLGHTFTSQTDTEVLAHLIGRAFDAGGGGGAEALVEAVRAGLRQVIGTYGIAVVHESVPGVLVGARRGSPLVLGVGSGEHFLASDVSAIVAHTREAVYLNDHEIVVLRGDGFEISTLGGSDASYEVSRVEYSAEDVDKGAYPHFMLKEIHEQPTTVRDAMRGRLSTEEATSKLGGLNMSNADLRAVERIVLSGCGTAFHAAMVGEYLIESLARLPVECEFSSELRYRNLPTTRDTLVFVISQSGETADTLAALRESQRKGHRTLGICNNVASTIARESDGGVYMHAGPEIGVAATKSFTSQLAVLTLLALLLGRIRYLSYAEGMRILDELHALPDKVSRVLELEPRIAAIAKKYARAKNFLFMGRQANYPIALEAALKLKEISYIASSGYPSAELKHGVIALVNETTPSVFIAPRDAVFEKNLSNIEEVRARNGPVVAVGTEGCDALERIADDVILVPAAPDYLTPILTTIPLQLLAYHIAVELGCDVDKPRNLAKSVTVE